MSPDMLVKWITARMKSMNITNQYLSDKSGVPKGTIDAIRAGKRDNFEFNTLQPILQVLVGASWGSDPCPFPPNTKEHLEAENAALVERNRHLYEQLVEAKGVIAIYREQNATYKKQITALNKQVKDSEKKLSLLEKQAKA
jgi:transcriptional regulator with XRE-family HTH domain